MPNHILNVLIFENITSKDKRDYLFNALTTVTTITPITPEKEIIVDFNKIIPEPTSIEEVTEGDGLKTEHSHVEIIDDKPWYDWYTWRNNHWGTKWNAYETKITYNSDHMVFIFQTAWNAPVPIIQRLPALGLPFELKYAKDYGSNCGTYIYPGSHSSKSLFHIEGDQEFAEKLWEEYG